MQHERSDCATAVLLARWRDGDDAAFSALEARLAPAIHGRVRRHSLWPWLSKAMEVEDIAQRVWARALPRIRNEFQDRGRHSLLRYLTPFIERELLDVQRRLRAQKHGAPERLATGFDTPGTPGGAAHETPTSAARVHEFLDRAQRLLSDDEYAAWELVAVEGYTDEELSSVLDRSPAAVRGLVLRARRKLQRAIAAESAIRRTAEPPPAKP